MLILTRRPGQAIYIGAALTLLLVACKTPAPQTLEEKHAAYNKPPPECAQLLMECSARWYCTPKYEARQYLFRVYRWDDCQRQYTRWAEKREAIIADLRAIDPAPTCFRLPADNVLSSFQIEPNHPYARELFAARFLGSSGDESCDTQLREWRARWRFREFSPSPGRDEKS